MNKQLYVHFPASAIFNNFNTTSVCADMCAKNSRHNDNNNNKTNHNINNKTFLHMLVIHHDIQ